MKLGYFYGNNCHFSPKVRGKHILMINLIFLCLNDMKKVIILHTYTYIYIYIYTFWLRHPNHK